MQLFSLITVPELQKIVTLVVFIGVFFLFMREKIPAHITAMSAMAVLLVAGVISTNDALSVFSNAAPMTVACMFVLSAALERTGVVDAIGQSLMDAAEKNRVLAIGAMLFGVMCVSAFMNNTPLVIIMAPVVIAVARRLQDYPSKYLIPLSYAAILGGTCTLIGTSTNIVVDGVARAHGQPPFSMFEISGAGVIMAVVGGVFLTLFGKRLLPERVLLENELVDERTRKRFISEAVVLPGSSLIGKTLNEVQFSNAEGYEIIDLVRNERGSRHNFGLFVSKVKSAIEESGDRRRRARSTLRDIPLQAGDRLVFKTDKHELLEIKQHLGLMLGGEKTHISDTLGARETMVVEGVIGTHSHFVGKRPSELRLRRRYSCYILAIHRDTQNITGNFDEVELKYGDVLLLEGHKDDLRRLFEAEEILSLTQLQQRPFQPKKAAFAVATIAGVVVLSSLDIMPIAGLGIIGAMLVILTGCIKPEKAYEAIDWRILMLIFGTIALSQGLEHTGIAEKIVMISAGWVKGFGPVAVLAVVYGFTSFITEFMSNNATGVLLTPIAIGLAQSLGYDPRPFIVAVMFGASASFATPIGYQTNTYVYNAGNYRFSDFLKIGVPMNLLMLVTAVIVIPMFWHF